MNKKSLLGLILSACLITAALFAATTYLIGQDSSNNIQSGQVSTTKDKTSPSPEKAGSADQESLAAGDAGNADKNTKDAMPTIAAANAVSAEVSEQENPTEAVTETNPTSEKGSDTANSDSSETYSTSVEASAPELICDSKSVDYQAFIPAMVVDSQLEDKLDISNPDIGVDATAAILFDADTKEVLYYKNAVQAMFPASTAKLLTALVALEWCAEDEEVTIGDEIKMIASDSTRAYLKEGEVLTVRNLLAAMLLPSGNDAAYAIAAHVGRKSLRETEASREEAVTEFARLMNKKAENLGVKNSCFKTPDGYDAVGQYTTAYDMGLIGMAAAANDTITAVSSQGSSRNIFPSGEDVTWTNTNKLVKKYSGQYFSHAIGLKTGTSSMAGRCLIAAARDGDQSAVCVIMDSSSTGRWEDAIELLKYGLQH